MELTNYHVNKDGVLARIGQPIYTPKPTYETHNEERTSIEVWGVGFPDNILWGVNFSYSSSVSKRFKFKRINNCVRAFETYKGL